MPSNPAAVAAVAPAGWHPLGPGGRHGLAACRELCGRAGARAVRRAASRLPGPCGPGRWAAAQPLPPCACLAGQRPAAWPPASHRRRSTAPAAQSNLRKQYLGDLVELRGALLNTMSLEPARAANLQHKLQLIDGALRLLEVRRWRAQWRAGYAGCRCQPRHVACFPVAALACFVLPAARLPLAACLLLTPPWPRG